MGLFGKSKKVERKMPEMIDLKAEDVIISANERQTATLEGIASDLQVRLKNEFRDMLAEVVDKALDNSRDDIEQMIRHELINMLESRMDELVEQGIKKHLTRTRQ